MARKSMYCNEIWKGLISDEARWSKAQKWETCGTMMEPRSLFELGQIAWRQMEVDDRTGVLSEGRKIIYIQQFEDQKKDRFRTCCNLSLHSETNRAQNAHLMQWCWDPDRLSCQVENKWGISERERRDGMYQLYPVVRYPKPPKFRASGRLPAKRAKDDGRQVGDKWDIAWSGRQMRHK